MTALLLDDSHALFHQCMDPYRAKGCIYLKNAEIDTASLHGSGEFGIGDSCYIDDTGHFNAAEFIMCYNQLMYMTLCAGVAEHNPAFRDWTMEDWWQRQLPNVLIQEFSSRYSRPINARGFHGEFSVVEFDTSRLERGILKLRTEVSFTDDNGGRARGQVLLALTDIPQPADSSSLIDAVNSAAALAVTS